MKMKSSIKTPTVVILIFSLIMLFAYGYNFLWLFSAICSTLSICISLNNDSKREQSEEQNKQAIANENKEDIQQ